MSLFTVLAWIATVYCAGGLLAALLVAVAGRDASAAGGQDAAGPHVRTLLMVFAAWPVVFALAATVGLHATLQRFRARP
jgi:hypothetical protein